MPPEKELSQGMEPANTIELILKATGLLIGVLFTTGLIVASLRLAQLGIVSVEFAKPMYVLTGMWTCLPVAIATTIWLLVSSGLEPSADGWWDRFGRATFFGILIAVTLGVCVWQIPKAANRFLNVMGFGDYFVIMTFALEIVAFVFVVALTPLARHFNVSSPGLIALFVCQGFFLSAFYLVVFAFSLYLQIPAQLGGGASRTFALTVSEPEVARVVTGDPNIKLLIVTPVLAETTTSYVLPATESVLKQFASARRSPGTYGSSITGIQGNTFLILPKSFVRVAAVTGVRPSEETYPQSREELEAHSPSSVSPTPVIEH
jgi:hypothetical protein